jgi:hypothetical protein
MRQRIIGLVAAPGTIYPSTVGKDGKNYAHRCVVDMAGVKLPRQRCPILLEHDKHLRVGWADWFQKGRDKALRVHGEVLANFVRAYAAGDRFGLSWYLEIERTVTLQHGDQRLVNGQLVEAVVEPLHVITAATLKEVTITRRPVDQRCYGRLLTPNDPPHLFAAGSKSSKVAARASKSRRMFARPTPALIRAAAGKGKLPTFEGLAYSGAPMTPEGWWTPVIIDLDGVKVPSQHRPALRQHDHEQVVGHTTSVKADRKGIHVKGVLSGEKHHVEKVALPAKNGFQWQLSIGANPVRTERLDDGKTTTVNGREVTGPMTIARETEIGEISFVPLGADQGTSVHVLSKARRSRVTGKARRGRVAAAA